MIGPTYWSTGIAITAADDRGWHIEASFYDNGFADDLVTQGRMSTEGVVRPRYVVPDLTAAVKILKRDVERLRIIFREPALYADTPEDKTGWPDDWRQQVEAAAAAIGFEPTGTTDLSKIPFGVDEHGRTVYLEPR
jgi:hypothetical protein